MRYLTPKEKAHLLAVMKPEQVDILKELAPDANVFVRKGHIEVTFHNTSVDMLNEAGDNRLIGRLRKKGLTEAEIAEALHISRQMVVYYNTGKRFLNRLVSERLRWISTGKCLSLEL